MTTILGTAISFTISTSFIQHYIYVLNNTVWYLMFHLSIQQIYCSRISILWDTGNGINNWGLLLPDYSVSLVSFWTWQPSLRRASAILYPSYSHHIGYFYIILSNHSNNSIFLFRSVYYWYWRSRWRA